MEKMFQNVHFLKRFYFIYFGESESAYMHVCPKEQEPVWGVGQRGRARERERTSSRPRAEFLDFGTRGRLDISQNQESDA